MSRKPWCVAAGALLLAAAVPAPAVAGIEPVPWHLAISNRSDAVLPESPFHLQPMTGMVVYFVVQDRLSDGGVGTRVIEHPLAGFAILPGETFRVDIPLPAGMSYLGWGFTAKMGVEPMPWRVYAMAGPAAEEPTALPVLPASLLSPEYGLYAFASPGTLVGAVALASEPLYAPCKPTDPWKNHGQYVRCVALAVGDLVAGGGITEEEADGIVSAAARSQVGK